MKMVLGIVAALILMLATQCSEDKAKYLEQATKYYNKNDYQNAFPLYQNVVLTDDTVSGTTLYRFAYTWEKIEPEKVSYYGPFYSASAYQFEQAGDTKNKYYSYAIAKEKNLNITHNGFTGENVKKIINRERRRHIKYYFSISPRTLTAIGFIIAIIGTLVFKGGLSGGTQSTNKRSQNEIKSVRKEVKVMANFYCKCCGQSFRDVKSLTVNSCGYSKTGKHQLFEGEESNHYYCAFCGQKFNSLGSLCFNSCQNSPTKKHVPYEGTEKTKYTCQYCGTTFNNMRSLCINSCRNSPTGKHHPAR